MNRILIPAVLAALTATPTLAQDPRPSQWDTGHPKVSALSKETEKKRAKTDDGIIISISEPEGRAAGAYVRWHFAQGERGEGASRFAQ